MREPLQELRDDSYERPNQPWVCGLTDAAGPCPLGPGKGGRCPAAAACQPVREGDRWRCSRSPNRGGPCAEGPSPEGECSHIFRCTPLMSLRLKRGRFVVGCVSLALGMLLITLSSNWRNEVLSPGELSSHHAQLLQGSATSERCANCHAAGPQTFGQWVHHATDDLLATPTQTELCMKCHQNRIDPTAATWAHNVKPQTLLTSHGDKEPVPSEARPHDPTAPLTCSMCHREHHGASHNLTWMSDTACQACHRQQYDSFATDHPEFSSWPATRRTRIAFDHGSHQTKHFPQEKHDFQCGMCHQPAEDDAIQRTLGYDATCATCHDTGIAASWEAGLPVFALPMLDTDALTQTEHDVGQWPNEATGEFDGPLPAITKLLIASDAPAAEAMNSLGGEFDFFDVDPDDPEQLADAADIVWATKELLHDIIMDGQTALRTRFTALVGREISTTELGKLTAHLTTENVVAITQLWLTRLPEEIAARRKTVAARPPQMIVAAPSDQDSKAVRDRVAGGGWFRDDLTLSIRYRPAGHADTFVTTWIDLLAEATGGPHGELAETLLGQQLAPTAPGLCGSCHSVDRSADGRLTVNWLARQSAENGFTVFSHGPHLTQAHLADCQACHAVNAEANVAAMYKTDSPHEFVDGFQPLSRESCAACHTADGAGDSCLVCHRYHAGLEDDPAR